MPGINNITPAEWENTFPLDINSIVIDRSLPKEQRIMDFVSTVKNPYRFRIGENIVNIRFSDSGSSIQQLLEQTIRRFNT